MATFEKFEYSHASQFSTRWADLDILRLARVALAMSAGFTEIGERRNFVTLTFRVVVFE